MTMSQIIPILAFLASACSTIPSGKEAATLEVTFNADLAEGAIMMALFDGPEGYQAQRPFAGSRGDVALGVATFTFTELEPGSYAIQAYHDLNGNEELDTNLTGMPIEPFAFSNNAPASYGPPSFEAARFDVKPGLNRQTISIR